MATQATKLADALSAALGNKKSDARKAYERAVAACDDAWDGVEGALSSRLYVLASEYHEDFRKAYARKVAAWFEWNAA